MLKNDVDPDWPQSTKRRMRIACRVTKATNTLSEYNAAFPLQQWSRERASTLLYTYIACLFNLPDYRWNFRLRVAV